MFIFQAHTVDLYAFIYERDHAEKHCISSAQISSKLHQYDIGVLCRVQFEVIDIWEFILFTRNSRSETGAHVPIPTAREVEYFQLIVLCSLGKSILKETEFSWSCLKAL